MKKISLTENLNNLDEIVKCNYEIFNGMYENAPYSLEQYKEKLKNADPVIFISKDNDTIIGNSVAFDRNNSFYIWILGVKQKYQRKGIGNSLLNENENYAMENGFASTSTKVYNVSQAMQKILKKRGYKEVSIEKSKNDNKFDAIIFELHFNNQ